MTLTRSLNDNPHLQREKASLRPAQEGSDLIFIFPLPASQD